MPPGCKVECGEGPTETKRVQSPFSSAPEISVVGEQTRCAGLCFCLDTQSCLTLCDPMDCSPPDSSVHGDSLGKNTGEGDILFSKGSSHPKDRIQVSHIAGRFFTIGTTRKAQEYWSG